MIFKSALFFLLITSQAFCELGSKNWKAFVEKGEQAVEFHATATPGFVKIHGKSDTGIKGNFFYKAPGKISGSFQFDLSTLKTGMSLRDKHMKENYLHVDKFPQARLEIPAFLVPSRVKELAFRGTLELHGVKKLVDGTLTLDPRGKKLRSKAEFTLYLSDFQIEVPTFAGISVKDEVRVKIEAESPFESAK